MPSYESYHNYVLRKLREEREAKMQLRFPSWCHIAPEPNPLRGRTTCDECGAIIPLTDEASVEMNRPSALVTVKHTGEGEIVFHFCDETCGNEFYLERLRREGL